MSVKLQQPANKEAMRSYFKMVSQGVEKTKLFASTMANVLENVIEEAFKKEMVAKTSMPSETRDGCTTLGSCTSTWTSTWLICW